MGANRFSSNRLIIGSLSTRNKGRLEALNGSNFSGIRESWTKTIDSRSNSHVIRSSWIIAICYYSCCSISSRWIYFDLIDREKDVYYWLHVVCQIKDFGFLILILLELLFFQTRFWLIVDFLQLISIILKLMLAILCTQQKNCKNSKFAVARNITILFVR